MNTNLNPVENTAPALPDTGRVSAYIANADEIDLLVLSCGASGYSYAQTAACLGISTQTLKGWSRGHPRFASVLARAHTLSQAWWEGRAMDGSANAVIGAPIWSRSMAARFPDEYTERKDLTSSDGSMSPAPREMTEEEVLKEMERRGLPIPDLD